MYRTMGVGIALLGVLLAGCIAGPDESSPVMPAFDFASAIVVEHDHLDVYQHTGSHGLEFVSWTALDRTLGENGFANFVIWQDDDEKLAYVAIDGDAHGGFGIVDIADPEAPTLLGTYWVEGNSIQEVRVTPDGRFAVMNVQDLPEPGRLTTPEVTDCTVCIHVVNVEDRTAPRFVSYMPVELLGTHNMDFVEQDGTLYLYYVGQALYLPYPDPGNHVYIARFEELPGGRAQLVPVNDFTHNSLDRAEGRNFPHDVLVQSHPLTGQTIAYVSQWDGGAVAFDVTDPMNPSFLSVEAEYAPSEALAIHWVMQEPEVRRDGRVIAWSVPEIGGLESGSGVLRAYDVTDPAAMHQIGTWDLPGDVWIPGRYIFSPHTAVPQQELGVLAVTHYHAGVWILDMTDPAAPEPLAYYLPHGDPGAPYEGPLWWKKPNFSPDGYGPNVYQARWDPDDARLLWISDRGTGLYALRLTVDVPGPVA